MRLLKLQDYSTSTTSQICISQFTCMYLYNKVISNSVKPPQYDQSSPPFYIQQNVLNFLEQLDQNKINALAALQLCTYWLIFRQTPYRSFPSTSRPPLKNIHPRNCRPTHRVLFPPTNVLTVENFFQTKKQRFQMYNHLEKE